MPKKVKTKSSPLTVRFPHELQDWVVKEAANYAAGKTGLIVEAVELLRATKEKDAPAGE